MRLGNDKRPPSDDKKKSEADKAPRRARGGGFVMGVAKSVLIVVAFVAYERLAPQEYKVSTFLGMFEGNTESEVLRGQIAGLKEKLATEKAAEEKMQNDINTYKLTLDAQLENYKNQLNLSSQKAVDTNRLNLERRNKITESLLAPIMKGEETVQQLSMLRGNIRSFDYTGVIMQITNEVNATLDEIEAEEAKKGQPSQNCTLIPNVALDGFKPFAREITTPSAPEQAVEAVSAPEPPTAPPVADFQRGVNDRTAWESWLADLESGDYL